MNNTLPELTEEAFFKEIKNLNIPLIKNTENSMQHAILYGPNSYKEATPSLKNIVDFFRDVSNNLKDNEEKMFVTERAKNLYIVSNSHILILMNTYIQVLDNQCNALFTFRSAQLNNFFSIHNRNFSYIFPEKKNVKPSKNLWFSDSGKDVQVTISGNKLKVASSGLNLTSLQFNPDTIFATFKGLPYVSLILDYNFNVKEINLHKKIKQHLDINEPIVCKNPNTATQEEIFNEIKEKLDDRLEFYSLIEDYEIPLNGSNKKADRDFSYIKEITSKKDKFLNVFEDNQDNLNTIKNCYKDFTLTHEKYNNNPKYFKLGLNADEILKKYELEVFTKNRQLYVLSFILLKNELKVPFINKDILNSYKKLDKEAIELMAFNKTMLKLKSTRKKLKG